MDHPPSGPAKAAIAPMLSVRRGAQAVAFYQAAFGAKELFRIDADDGAVVAQLAVGGAEFWVADESPEHGNFSPESVGGSTTRMVMVVDDPMPCSSRHCPRVQAKSGPSPSNMAGASAGSLIPTAITGKSASRLGEQCAIRRQPGWTPSAPMT